MSFCYLCFTFFVLYQGVAQVLVKMGANGSVLVRDQEPPVFQSALQAPVVVDTTGAGDTFTAAYAVALIERQPSAEALRFAGKLSTSISNAIMFSWTNFQLPKISRNL